jgi:hypothetical protein
MWVSLRRRRTRSAEETADRERRGGEQPADQYVPRVVHDEVAPGDPHDPAGHAGGNGVRHEADSASATAVTDIAGVLDGTDGAVERASRRQTRSCSVRSSLAQPQDQPFRRVFQVSFHLFRLSSAIMHQRRGTKRIRPSVVTDR